MRRALAVVLLAVGCGNGSVDGGPLVGDADADSDTDTASASETGGDADSDGDADGDGDGDADSDSDSDSDTGTGSDPGPACGDGVLDAGEECDDGALNSDVLADACRTTCARPVCGDGAVDTGEACDDGAENADDVPDACRTTCVLPACGDGVVDTAEGCDDGPDNSDVLADACRSDCAPARCTDGVLDAGETCDPCPEACDDGDPCTNDSMLGAPDTCDVACDRAVSGLCFQVDVDTTGNVYASDPDGDGSDVDNALSVGAVDACVEIVVDEFPALRKVDVVGKGISEATCTQERFLVDSALAEISSVDHTPWGFGSVGFLDLPVDPDTEERRGVLEINSTMLGGVEGSAALAACYTGARTDLFNADHPHASSEAEPYSTDDPDGVVLVRFDLVLLEASDGALVTIDLVNDAVPNEYIATAFGRTVLVPDEAIYDATIAVNTECP